LTKQVSTTDKDKTLIMKDRKKSKRKFKLGLTAIVILVTLAIAILAYLFIFGDPSNFQGNSRDNLPLPNNYFGIIYKGGIIVPLLMCVMLVMLTFSVERFIAIRKAEGFDPVIDFVKEIQDKVAHGRIDEALEDCDEQKGSVANVLSSVLKKYKEVEYEDMEKDQKLTAIQKEIEEATALELPGLEQNLVILSTITSVATMLGLLGTVLGMIRAFSALANAGAPDSVQLASGISEALVNTALGIGTAILATVAYNYFSTRIDKLLFCIDEAGFSIVQTYAAKHKMKNN